MQSYLRCFIRAIRILARCPADNFSFACGYAAFIE